MKTTSMNGKTCLITGANSGIGFETAKTLAQLGAQVVMVCRDPAKGREAQQKIIQASNNDKVDLLIADLTLMSSVRQLAEEVNRLYPALHVLINNAGIMLSKRELTPEGYERQYAVNYLAPFLLTHLLLDKLKASQPARIVNISSKMHSMTGLEFDNLQAEKKFGPFKTYAMSKLALPLFTYSLARRLQGTGVTVNCLHPGVIGSNIGSTPAFIKLFMKSPKTGAKLPVYLASSPEVEIMNGKYYMGFKPVPSSAETYRQDLADKLWNLTLQETGLSKAKAVDAA